MYKDNVIKLNIEKCNVMVGTDDDGIFRISVEWSDRTLPENTKAILDIVAVYECLEHDLRVRLDIPDLKLHEIISEIKANLGLRGCYNIKD